jgi:predicted  nucleic acid-binding Zn-ribbon protein
VQAAFMAAINALALASKGHTGVLEALRETQVEHGKRLTSIDSKVTNIESRLDRMDTRFDRLEELIKRSGRTA